MNTATATQATETDAEVRGLIVNVITDRRGRDMRSNPPHMHIALAGFEDAILVGDEKTKAGRRCTTWTPRGRPVLRLVVRRSGKGHIVHAEPLAAPEGMCGPVFDGRFISCSDSRFGGMIEELIGGPFYGAIPVHDRWDSAELYHALTI